LDFFAATSSSSIGAGDNGGVIGMSSSEGEMLRHYEEKASARRKKQRRQQRNSKLVNSKNTSPSVYKAFARRNVGHDVAREAEVGSPLTGGKFGKLLHCPCATVNVQSNHHRE
jgi:hypothetical protein